MAGVLNVICVQILEVPCVVGLVLHGYKVERYAGGTQVVQYDIRLAYLH